MQYKNYYPKLAVVKLQYFSSYTVYTGNMTMISYETIEVSALGHYQPASIGNIQNFIQLSNSNTSISKLAIIDSV